jgi:6-phosphogluconolactonase
LRNRRTSYFLAACLLAALPCRAAEFLVYAGTYTSHGSKGIYAWRFQTGKGKLTPLGVAAETGNPSFLVEHPNHKFLYAANENGDQGVLGTVSAYAIGSANGKLTPLNWVSSKGGAPCHLAIDRSGKWLAVANYAGGSIAVLPIQSDGRLGDAVALDPRQGSHPAGVLFSPDNRFLLAADRGLDRIQVYRFDAAKGAIAASETAAIPGVRHFAFHPSGKALYAVSEKASAVSAFHWNAGTGVLQEFQTVPTIPEGFGGVNTAAEIAVNPAGTMLYASNRGLDALAQFAIDGEKLSLTIMEYPPVMGRTPRHFALDPTGAYLFAANQDSADLTVFRVHPRTGQLQPAAAVGKHVPNPTCVVFVPVR